MEKTKLFNRIALLLLTLSLIVSTASAAKEVGLSDFQNKNSNPVDGAGDTKPIMVEVVEWVGAIFLFSCVIAVLASGSKANIGTIFHNASLRINGIIGAISIVGVIFVVILAIVMGFHFYNKYIIGSA